MPLPTSPPNAATQQVSAAIIKCGGCFEPVNVETAIKRTIPAPVSRYSRFSRGKVTPPAQEHFCGSACHQRAATDSHGNGGLRF
jgi:hypothetical protein